MDVLGGGYLQPRGGFSRDATLDVVVTLLARSYFFRYAVYIGFSAAGVAVGSLSSGSGWLSGRCGLNFLGCRLWL